MSANAPILIATEAVADAELVAALLRDEFDNVHLSTKSEMAVADFEEHKPAVLILAFDTLEKAQNYYLGLYRLSTIAPTVVHRTLILCNASELWKVYELCKKTHFDDYVLFWPATNDAPRIRMAVHQLLRQTRQTPGDTVSAGQFAAGARQLTAGDDALADHARAGGAHVDGATRALLLAQQNIGAALEDFNATMARMSHGAGMGTAAQEALRQALDTLRRDAIPAHLASANASVERMREWVDEFEAQAKSRLEDGRTVRAMVDRFKPLVLVVDDDDYQQKLLQRVLGDAALRLVFASSGLEGLAMLRQMRPDLVLMDIELPDITGVEATRRVRRIPYMTDVPVIMITGHSERSVVVECLRAGAADFAIKPFQKATLLAKIEGALSKVGKVAA